MPIERETLTLNTFSRAALIKTKGIEKEREGGRMTKMTFFISLAVKFLINKFAFDVQRQKQVFNECTMRL